MPKNGQVMTSLEMRNLIFEALAEENEDNTPWKMTFKMYGYKGCVSALRAIVEHLAIKHNLVDKVAEIPLSAWGVPGFNLRYKSDSNFTEDEVNLFTEEVHLLMFQNVLSPGAQGGYGDDWPYFHVTKYGLECLKQNDILPYDPNAYMSRISAIASVDDWEKFYINQSLLCYNASAFESSLIMLGLAGEYLATKLIDSLSGFLAKNEPTEATNFASNLNGKTKISQRYSEYEKSLDTVSKLKDQANSNKYPQLKALKPSLDGAAKVVYATYLRLTRNEMAHPAQLKMDRIECLIMIVSYIKYCETQHKYLDYYNSNS